MTVYAVNGLGRMGKLALKPLLEQWINKTGHLSRPTLPTMH